MTGISHERFLRAAEEWRRLFVLRLTRNSAEVAAMPATYRIDVESQLVVITWPGTTPDVHAWRGVIQKLVFDPMFPTGARILSDWRLADGAPDQDFIENFIHALDLLQARGVVRWATVIPPTQLAYGVGRMAELRAEVRNLHFRVFSDYAEVEAWLLGDLQRIGST